MNQPAGHFRVGGSWGATKHLLTGVMSEMLGFLYNISGQSFTLMLWDLGPLPRCLNLDVYVQRVTVVDRLIYMSGDIVVKQKKCIEVVL